MLWDLGCCDMGRRKFPLRKRVLMRPLKFRWPHYGGVDKQFDGVHSIYIHKANSLASDRPKQAQPNRRK
jgi:hypothetical protein